MAEKQELRIPLSEAKAYGNGKDVFCELLHTGKIGNMGWHIFNGKKMAWMGLYPSKRIIC